MKYILLASVVLCCGCAPTPIKPIVFEYKTFEKVEKLDLKVLKMVEKPIAIPIEYENQTYAAYTSEGLDALSKMYVVAKTNTEALEQLLEGYNFTIEERNNLVALLELERERTKILADQYVMAENQRRYEEWSNQYQQTFYKILTVILAIGIISL